MPLSTEAESGTAQGSAPAPIPEVHLGLGILFTLLAFLAVALMSACAKAASASVSSGVVTFVANFISFLLLLPWVVRYGFANLRTQRLKLLVARSVTDVLSLLFLFMALQFIPLVNAVLLSNAAPLFIPLIVWLWLGKRIGAKLWGCLVLGFLGITLIVQPGADVFSWATLLALMAGLLSAIQLVEVGELQSTEPTVRILFYYFLLSSMLTAPFLVFSWPSPEPVVWLWLLGVGVLMALVQFLLVLAYEQAPPSRLSPFNYSVVVFSGLIGWAGWGAVPNWLELVGIVTVAVAGILSTLHFHKVHGPLSAPRPQGGKRGDARLSGDAPKLI